MSLFLVCPEGHRVAVAADKLGSVVTCPCCFTQFLAELSIAPAHNARKEVSKSRRSRDDDDDDDDDDEDDDEEEDDEEEDERPRKKAKKTKDDEDEDEKPRKKAKKTKDEDDEDEDEDDEEEEDDDEPTAKKKTRRPLEDAEEEEDEPIEWTPRKRQLSICSSAVIVIIVSSYLMGAFAVFSTLSMVCYELFDEAKTPTMGPFVFYWFTVPFAYLTLFAILITMFMAFATPAKVEAKAPVISAIVFGFLVLFQALLIILTWNEWLTDATRVEKFVQLLTTGSIICFILSTMSAMSYLSRLLFFMNLRLEASAPITNMGFIFMTFLAMLGLLYADPLVKSNIADWLGYIIALAFAVIAGFCIYLLIFHIFLLMKLRDAIAKYIREA